MNFALDLQETLFCCVVFGRWGDSLETSPKHHRSKSNEITVLGEEVSKVNCRKVTERHLC